MPGHARDRLGGLRDRVGLTLSAPGEGRFRGLTFSRRNEGGDAVEQYRTQYLALDFPDVLAALQSQDRQIVG
jgi:hypothetical protein